jgi:hypothetical protein
MRAGGASAASDAKGHKKTPAMAARMLRRPVPVVVIAEEKAGQETDSLSLLMPAVWLKPQST